MKNALWGTYHQTYFFEMEYYHIYKSRHFKYVTLYYVTLFIENGQNIGLQLTDSWLGTSLYKNLILSFWK